MIPSELVETLAGYSLTAEEIEKEIQIFKDQIKKNHGCPPASTYLVILHHEIGKGKEVQRMAMSLGAVRPPEMDPEDYQETIRDYFFNLGHLVHSKKIIPAGVLLVGLAPVVQSEENKAVIFDDLKEGEVCYSIAGQALKQSSAKIHLSKIAMVRDRPTLAGKCLERELEHEFINCFFDGFCSAYQGLPPKDSGSIVDFDLTEKGNGRPAPPETPRKVVCPLCRGPLTDLMKKPADYIGTQELWDSEKAGDYRCETCPDNGRGNSGKCYFWERELPPLDPNGK